MDNNIMVELMSLDNDKLIEIYNELLKHIKFLNSNLINTEREDKNG